MELSRLEVSVCTARIDWYRKRVEDMCLYSRSSNNDELISVDEVLRKFELVKDNERRGRQELKNALSFSLKDWGSGEVVFLPGEAFDGKEEVGWDLQVSGERKQ